MQRILLREAMKTYVKAGNYGVIPSINQTDAKTYIRKHPIQYVSVTTPFIYDGIEFDTVSLKKESRKIKTDGEHIFIIGTRKVWQLNPVKS
jgi:hypothetical protein